jgi:PilZ domain
MGQRSEPRVYVQVPVRLFGTDADGAVFSGKALTVNISANGVELDGVHQKLALDEIVGLTYGTNRVHFRVRWIGAPDTPKSGHIGLRNISPEKPLWDFPVPQPMLDGHQAAFADRRKHPRFRCQNSVEIHVPNGTSFWATVADLSLGGCYVEMPIPLELGAKLTVAIWLDQVKAKAEGKIAHKTPGMGIGIKFTRISDADLEQIRTFLARLAPLARKRTLGTSALPPG